MCKQMPSLSWWMWWLLKDGGLVPGNVGTHLPYLQHLWPAELAPGCGPHYQRCCPVARAVGWYFQSCSKDRAVCWLISLLWVRLQNKFIIVSWEKVKYRSSHWHYLSSVMFGSQILDRMAQSQVIPFLNTSWILACDLVIRSSFLTTTEENKSLFFDP